MKVIVNALGYVGQGAGAGGAGVFLQYLVSKLTEICAVDVLVAPNSKSFRGDRPKGRIIELPHLTSDTLQRLREGPTVVLDPFGGLPCPDFPADMALCAVVHDLMHLERPYYFTAAERQERSTLFAAGLQRADAAVVFSEHQARAVRRYFPGVRPVVIHHLPYMTLRERTGADAKPGLPADLGDFALFPAVKWPHKNHKTAIEAFGAYVRRSGSRLRLALCGGTCAETRFSYMPSSDEVSEQIVDLGQVGDETLDALFAEAKAVIFPTLYEGFGIPVLEAAYLGKMVVASALAVFDEILGEPNYRRVVDPLCHLRWMEAFADIEGPAREEFEQRARRVRPRVDAAAFISKFADVLEACAARYTHPSRYPLRGFPNGDRPTSTVVAALNFTDVHGAATLERGSRYPVLGAKPTTRFSSIYRTSAMAPDCIHCLRAEFDVTPTPGDTAGSLQFSAWVKLHSYCGLEALHVSTGDRRQIDILPQLSDGEWHLVRMAIAKRGFVDIQGGVTGTSEDAGFDIEIHDPSVVRQDVLAPPREEPPKRSLTVFVAAMGSGASLPQIASRVADINALLLAAKSEVTWVVVTHAASLSAGFAAAELPANLRVHVAVNEAFGRTEATGLASPYCPIDLALLLEEADLAALLDPRRIQTLTAALGPAPLGRDAALTLDRTGPALWLPEERGRFLQLGRRVGQPIPPLDPRAIQAALTEEQPEARPRFALIETDRTSGLGHHSAVSGLFLDGADALGFRRVLGLGRGATGVSNNGRVEVWAGFSPQVYQVGTADAFADELAQFVAAVGIGPDDVVFMHSLSPQILLGAARFVASDPARAPSFIMRFFSTAEAMAGHRLSYIKILRSIESVAIVRRKMHFFCESVNLVDYYEQRAGKRFPLLFNPESPSLALVRDSLWFDPGMGEGKIPVLAYFGEAREEKGFDEVPGIVSELLAAESMAAFQFLIQTGSNRINETPKIARAKAALSALKAKHSGRVRTFASVETSEQLYFMMKHATGVIAPYNRAAYGKRGSGVTLEALQMGCDVFTWTDTDLYATFRATGRVIGVSGSSSFSRTIIDHYTSAEAPKAGEMALPLSQTPREVCERLLALSVRESAPAASASGEPVLWVGNDTFGEGCSAVYAAQRLALRTLGRDCFELFVPWPDANLAGSNSGDWDAKIYGFDSLYESKGLAWVAIPNYNTTMQATLSDIQRKGPTYKRLRTLNENFTVPATLRRLATNGGAPMTLLNYVHLYPVIADFIPPSQIVCETHDIIAYQHAVRRGDQISISEKIDEFSDMAQLPRIVAINLDERQEMAAACASSQVYWRPPPYAPESAPIVEIETNALNHVVPLVALGGVPEHVAMPSSRMLSVYWSRLDLQSTFRLDTLEGRMAFFRWWFVYGQFESNKGFALEKRQFDWIVGDLSADKTPTLAGMLTLILSLRTDLWTTFGGQKAFRLKELLAWTHRNLEREFGFSPQQLLQYGHREFGRVEAGPAPRPGSALAAVLEADPFGRARSIDDTRLLCDRLADVQQIDLALVGSGHPGNVKSFQWFLHEVFFRYLAVRGCNVFIAGSVADQFRNISHRNVFLLGRCRLVEPILRVSRACPLPVVVGSGSPIKAIPAFAVNGAVTVTEQIDRAFGLTDYGIPAFIEPREFADDIWALLGDDEHRKDRCARARKYVDENLTIDGYVKFWEELWAS